MIVECLDFLGSEPLKFKELEDPLREGALQLLVVLQLSRGHEFRDFLSDRLADPLDLAEATLCHDGLDRFAERLQRAGGISVGPDLEGILSLEFEQLGDVL